MKVVHLLSLPALGLLACDSANSSSAPRLFAMQSLRDEASANRNIAGIPASDWVTLRGNPIPMLSPPFANSTAYQVADKDGLNVLPAFSEGKTAAFVVAEVWRDIPEVWIQPWYSLVTSYNPANPGATRLTGAMPIVDIDTTSWFYSPFWELVYVVVPSDTAPDKYVSASQLFQDNLEMHRNGSLLAPLSANDMAPATTSASAPALRPLSNDPVGPTFPIPIALKGATRPSLIFATANFTWDSTGVVDEVPMFVFSKLGDDGTPVSLRLPSVIGTGPLGAARPPRVTSAGAPQYGSLTRVYHTLLPPAAGPFIPASLGQLRNYYTSQGVRVVASDISVDTRPDAKDYVGRVSLNPQCFAMPLASNFPSSCQWLDSQSAVEANLAQANIIRQSILLTSPLVLSNVRR